MNGVQLNHEAIARKNPFLEKNEIEYDWAVNEIFCSLWIHTNVDQYSWDEYWVYNVDIMTGEEMSRESCASGPMELQRMNIMKGLYKYWGLTTGVTGSKIMKISIIKTLLIGLIRV